MQDDPLYKSGAAGTDVCWGSPHSVPGSGGTWELPSKSKAPKEAAGGGWMDGEPCAFPACVPLHSAAAEQDAQGEAGATRKVSCLPTSCNYAASPYH